jgi:hypothetical protein
LFNLTKHQQESFGCDEVDLTKATMIIARYKAIAALL